jgi:hypothetical protein
MKTKITILRAHHRGWRNAKIRRTVGWLQRWYLYLAPDTPVIKRLLAVYEMGRRHGKAEERMKRTRYGESTATARMDDSLRRLRTGTRSGRQTETAS